MSAPRPAAAIALLGSLALGGCYSVSYGPAGYERRGVWLPRVAAGEPGADRELARVIVVGGHEARFDGELRLYRLVDPPERFYSAGWYYRRSDGGWESARSLGGRWRRLPDAQVPPTLLALPIESEGATS